MPDDDHLLELFERLALEAGKRILEVREGGVAAETKRDSSPVTQADRAAEEIILRGLRNALPGMACIAEEEVAAGIVCDGDANEFILVDPLDGTREFIAGKPDFTVNIALVRDGEPVVGTVYAPARGELYSGRPGRATLTRVDARSSPGSRRPISMRPMPERPTVVASRSHRTPPTDAFIARLPGAETCAIGSSLKFGLLASGEADLYPRFGPTMQWDTAAGDAVLRAAGGRTMTLDGKLLAYGWHDGRPGSADFANPWFIACGADCPALETALRYCRELAD